MTNPDRDAAVDRLLRSTRMDPPAADGVCLDADTLAAWADGSLAPAAYAAVERHAADCARCQALLAAMARTEPASATPARSWSPWAFFRWAVPLTAAAAAIALWVIVDRGDDSRRTSELTVQTPTPPPREARSDVPQRAPSAEQSAPAPAPSPRLSTNAKDADARPQRRPDEVRQQARDRSALLDRAERKEVAAQPGSEALKEQVANAPPPAGSLPAATPLSAPPPAATPAGPPSPAAQPTAVATPTATESVTETARSAVAKREAARFRTAAPAWIDVASPDPLVRWRFTSRGEIQRTVDGGVTWTTEKQVSGQIGGGLLTAGSAPSSAVCWLAGRGGVVLRFTSALGWQRLRLPGTGDVVAIEAQGADTASVTLANGRRLATIDGGATWK